MTKPQPKNWICPACGVCKKHCARGLCRSCYDYMQTLERKKRMKIDPNEAYEETLARHAVMNKEAGGRPVYWTEEVINDLADELTKWSKRSCALVMGEFATDRDYDPAILNVLCGQNKLFASAYKSALLRIGARREKGALGKHYDPTVYKQCARMYDESLDKHLETRLEKDEFIKERAKARAMTQELKSQGDILEFMKKQKEVKEGD